MQRGAQGENAHGKRCKLEKMKMEALGVPPRSLCVAGSTEDWIAGLRAASHNNLAVPGKGDDKCSDNFPPQCQKREAQPRLSGRHITHSLTVTPSDVIILKYPYCFYI